MADSLNVSTYTPILREYIANQAPIIYKSESPFFNRLATAAGEGKSWEFPVQHAPASGYSNDYATAKANRKNTKYQEFIILTKNQTADFYQEFGVSNKVIELSRSSKGSVGVEDGILGAYESEARAAMENVIARTHVQCWRNGTGSIGQLAASSSGAATTTLVLANESEMNNFEVGMVLEGSATDGSALYSGQATIVGIDRAAREIVVDKASGAGGISGLTDGDFLYIAGTGQNGTSNEERVIRGVPAWIPVAAPGGSDSFFSVNRSVDVERLAGIRFDGTGLGTHRGALKSLLTRIRRYSPRARPTDVYLNPDDMEVISNELENGNTFFQPVDSEFGHNSIKAHVGAFTVTLHAESYQQKGVFHALDMSTWKLMHSPAGFPFLDPTTKDHAENEDAQVAMIKAYCQLACKAPGWNGVGTFRNVSV